MLTLPIPAVMWFQDETRRLEDGTMSEIRERLGKGFAVLQRLDKRRLDTKSPKLGYNAEHLIIARELSELEADIFQDPGALEAHFVRPRRKLLP
jgi:hypothetical protein